MPAIKNAYNIPLIRRLVFASMLLRLSLAWLVMGHHLAGSGPGFQSFSGLSSPPVKGYNISTVDLSLATFFSHSVLVHTYTSCSLDFAYTLVSGGSFARRFATLFWGLLGRQNKKHYTLHTALGLASSLPFMFTVTCCIYWSFL